MIKRVRHRDYIELLCDDKHISSCDNDQEADEEEREFIRKQCIKQMIH